MKSLSLFFVCSLVAIFSYGQQKDTPFDQYVSVKYKPSEEFLNAKPLKLLIDYNDAVYILTDKGVFREFPENIVAKDNSYWSIADKIPVDMCIQEEKGVLFYLFSNGFLSNGYAGRIGVKFTEGENYGLMAVDRNDQILLVGDEFSAIYKGNQKLTEWKSPSDKIKKLYAIDHSFYALSENNIYVLSDGKWKTIYVGSGLNALVFEEDKIVVGSQKGYFSIDNTGRIVETLETALPVTEISQMIKGNSVFWFASPEGAFVKEGDRYRYFASKRWLSRDEVIDMALDSKGNVYLLNIDGLNKVELQEMTLAKKAEFFQDRIRKYFLRYGFVCAPKLREPFDFSSEHIIDHDNDGLWTSFYLGSQAFRYATTGEEIAKRYVWESFAPFERIIDINPIEGFPARTFERKGFKVSDHERWRDSEEEGWEWKGTTSSDEYIAYLFVASVIDQLVAETPKEKKRVADFIDAIMTHIITNDYKFIDHDGKPTTWGRWDPEYVNMYPKHVYDRKLNSTHLIAGLQLAFKLTGKEVYRSEMTKMIKEYGYLDNMMSSMYEMRADTVNYIGHIMGDTWNHSDDEMAFLTYWPLYHYAINDSLKSNYSKIIAEHWEIELPERNAAWNLLTYGTVGQIKEEDVFWHLREFNLDQTDYLIKNSHRKDLHFLEPNFRDQKTEVLLTPGERPTHRHNANPFRLDGGRNGTSVLAGDEFLLPYWMGRYLKIIK